MCVDKITGSEPGYDAESQAESPISPVGEAYFSAQGVRPEDDEIKRLNVNALTHAALPPVTKANQSRRSPDRCCASQEPVAAASSPLLELR